VTRLLEVRRSDIGKGKPGIASGRLFPSLFPSLYVFFPYVFADYVEGNARKFVARLANLFRSEWARRWGGTSRLKFWVRRDPTKLELNIVVVKASTPVFPLIDESLFWTWDFATVTWMGYIEHFFSLELSENWTSIASMAG
jgi:hypothetical protein